MRSITGVALFTGLMMAVTPEGTAQVRASELGVSAQTVDGTTITVEYSRPRARGRSPLFGGVVHWGEHWTPGANWATTFETNRDVTIDGQAVPAGKYSMWMVVQPDEWTVYLDPNARLFHTDPPDSSDRQVRIKVKPQTSENFMETMTMWFPDVSATSMKLVTQWGDTYVPLTIAVEPSRPITLAQEVAQRYVGSYAITWDFPGEPPSEAAYEVYYEDGMLQGRQQPAPAWFRHMILIEIADDWFWPGLMEDGELFDVMSGLTLEFELEDGMANGFEVRWQDDELMATAVRQE